MIYLLLRERGIESSESLVSFLVGIIYGSGLMIGGALRPSVVIGFLTLDKSEWNPTLLVLMVTVSFLNYALFSVIIGRPQRISDDEDYQLLGEE